MIPFNDVSGIGKFLEIEGESEISQLRTEEGIRRYCLMGKKFLFGVMENWK